MPAFQGYPCCPATHRKLTKVFFLSGLSHSKCDCRRAAMGGKTAPTPPQSAPGGLFSGRASLPSWAVGRAESDAVCAISRYNPLGEPVFGFGRRKMRQAIVLDRQTGKNEDIGRKSSEMVRFASIGTRPSKNNLVFSY